MTGKTQASAINYNLHGQQERREAFVNACKGLFLYLGVLAIYFLVIGGLNLTSCFYAVGSCSVLILFQRLERSPIFSVLNRESPSWTFATLTVLGALQIISPLVNAKGAAAAMSIMPIGMLIFLFSARRLQASLIFICCTALWVSIDFLWEVPFRPQADILTESIPVLFSFMTCVIAVLKIALKSSFQSQHAIATLQAYELDQQKKVKQLSHLELQLKQANDEALLEREKLDAELSEGKEVASALASNLSEVAAVTQAVHQDLREPLRTLTSFSQLLRRKLVKDGSFEGVTDYFGFVEDGALRMAKMLDDLLNYAVSNDDEKAQVVDLNDIVKRLHRDLDNLIERNGATLSHGDLPAVLGYQTQLIQLFQNLVTNALKFGKPDVSPAVHISSFKMDGGAVRIEVTDNGIGIPPERIDSVFGLFNRAHETEGYEGSGVGLALCQKIVIAHGASISVRSEVSKGTTFEITFPECSVCSVISTISGFELVNV